MEQICIAGRMIELLDDRLEFRLLEVSPKSCTIQTQLRVDIGDGEIYMIPEPHNEAILNSPEGRQRLSVYPQTVQDWLIPGIWGEEALVEEKKELGAFSQLERDLGEEFK